MPRVDPGARPLGLPLSCRLRIAVFPAATFTAPSDSKFYRLGPRRRRLVVWMLRADTALSFLSDTIVRRAASFPTTYRPEALLFPVFIFQTEVSPISKVVAFFFWLCKEIFAKALERCTQIAAWALESSSPVPFLSFRKCSYRQLLRFLRCKLRYSSTANRIWLRTTSCP